MGQGEQKSMGSDRRLRRVSKAQGYDRRWDKMSRSQGDLIGDKEPGKILRAGSA